MTSTDPAWFGLARQALDLSIQACRQACRQAGSEAGATAARAAGAAVEEIETLYGPDVIPAVICAWIDTFTIHVGLVGPPGKDGQPGFLDHPVQLLFQDADTGEITANADDLGPDIAWAARVINSRACMDADMFTALIDACGTAEVWSARVATVLMLCGANIAGGGVS